MVNHSFATLPAFRENHKPVIVVLEEFDQFSARQNPTLGHMRLSVSVLPEAREAR